MALTETHKLLPEVQFAFSGRSAEDALVFNFGYILSRWQNRKVSQMFLDMKGAYDRGEQTPISPVYLSDGPNGLFCQYQFPGLTLPQYAVRSL